MSDEVKLLPCEELVKRVAKAIDDALPESDRLTLAPSQIRRAAIAAIEATRPTEQGLGVTIPSELYAFLMGEGPLEGVWFGDLNEGLKGAFWWRALLRCAAGWPAPPAQGTSHD